MRPHRLYDYVHKIYYFHFLDLFISLGLFHNRPSTRKLIRSILQLVAVIGHTRAISASTEKKIQFMRCCIFESWIIPVKLTSVVLGGWLVDARILRSRYLNNNNNNKKQSVLQVWVANYWKRFASIDRRLDLATLKHFIRAKNKIIMPNGQKCGSWVLDLFYGRFLVLLYVWIRQQSQSNWI